MSGGKRHNPFSSYRVEPDAGGYIFADGNSLQDLCSRLEMAGWRGTLTGPCGAGKSTLLTDVCGVLQNQGKRVVRGRCNDEARWLPAKFAGEMMRGEVLAIDGCEQLVPGLLWFIRMFTRLTGKGLLVTAHANRGPGLIIPVEPSCEAVTEKAASLLGVNAAEIAERVEELYARHNGNAREVMFDLYLQYEADEMPALKTRSN